jgi:hypothetical protein
MTGTAKHRLQVIAGMAVAVLLASPGTTAVAADPVATDVASFLSLRGIDQTERSGIESAVEWNAAAEGVAIKVLERLAAPAALVAAWRPAASPVAAAGETVAVGDSLVTVRGRAIFTAPHRLTEDDAVLFGQPSYDLVRLVDERGTVVDVITPAAPRDWPRWQMIDQPAGVLGLPLSTVVAPRPSDPPVPGPAWPDGKAGLLLAAAHVAWYPDTSLGRLGMDYGLFDSVVDGKKLSAGDTAAFFALLAAAAKIEPRAIATAAGGASDVMSLIDPARKWFPSHRGDPVVIEGTALRARRVPIDEPFRRQELGLDHYWELFVFVETPLLDVDGRLQNAYPIVCCVRELPPGMPTGERINEQVRVPGFGFKRYAYGFDAPREEKEGMVTVATERRQTTLVIGPAAIWTPTQAVASDRSVQIFLGLAAVAALATMFGLGILYGTWSVNRTIRRSRAALPDRIDLPEENR